MVADDFDTEMNKLTKQLRQQTQEEVLEVGDVDEVKKLLACVCEWMSARVGVKWHGGSIKEILNINDELLKLFDVQSFHREVGLAQEEVLVACGEDG